MTLTRRDLFQLTGGLAATVAASSLGAEAASPAVPAALAALRPMVDDMTPIGVDERRRRLARTQALMADAGLDAIVMASGTTLSYFTGAEWGQSERFFGAVLTREGEPAWITPAFESARAHEQIQIGTDVRAWEEHESPFALLAALLR